MEKTVRNRFQTDLQPNTDTYFSDENPKSISMTIQADKDHADINQIIGKALKGEPFGDSQNINTDIMQYGDFSQLDDFAEISRQVANVQTAFNRQPAKIRNMFKGNPQKLISFLDNPNNREEAIELGLMKRPNADFDQITGELIENDWYPLIKKFDTQGKAIPNAIIEEKTEETEESTEKSE